MHFFEIYFIILDVYFIEWGLFMEIIKKSLKLYGLCILGSIMCIVLVATFNMIGANAFGKQIGYSMQGEIEGKEEDPVILYEYRYADGEDVKKQEYIDKGYTLTEIPVKTTTATWDVIAQICILVMMGVFVYNELWKTGFKDMSFVQRGDIKEDKLKGLKIGLLTASPSIVLLAALVIGRTTFAKGISVANFSLVNPHLNRALYLLSGCKGAYISELEVWQIIVMFMLLLIIPLIATIAYILGYKSIVVSEKLIYKKNREN